jgi:membrane associated rhomboid family serine protease
VSGLSGDPDSSAIMGLVEGRDSAIKAVSSAHMQQMDDGEPEVEQVLPPSPFQQQAPQQDGVLLPSLAGPAPERMMVMAAGGLGKSSGKLNTPRSASKKSGSHARTPSGAVSIDIVARANSRTPARELDRLHVENRAPPRFICPISGRIMRDPVILGTGTTCDRGSLERYLAKGHKRCPVTKRPLKKPIHTMPNMELRQNIIAWAKRNAPWLVDRDGHLKSNEPGAEELQGKDPQYVTPMVDEEAPAAGNSMGRTESNKSSWKFTNGSKVRPGAVNYDINASTGRAGSAAVSTPWQSSRGIASAPRSMRRSRSRSASPSKRTRATRDWYSTGFMGVISLTTLLLFIMALMKGNWKMEPLSTNPWYGPSAQALTDVGAQVLPLMEGSGKSYWRLFSSIFLPAGAIHFAISLVGLWMYGRYAQLALPLPQASVAGVYLLSGLVGAMVSANLNAYFVSCGAFAGVLGLLGTVCADQMLNFETKKLFNFKEWWLVSFILLVNAGGFITASLLPMVGVWYSAAAFLAGFLLSYVLIVLPRVGRGKPGNAKWASAQIICALILVGGFTAAVVGVAMPNKLGESQSVLKTASCIDFGSMKCTPYGFLPNGCGISLATSNSSATSNMLTCPQPATAVIPLPSDAQFTYGDATSTEALCTQYCADALAALAPGAAPTTEIIMPADVQTIVPSATTTTPPTPTTTIIIPSTNPAPPAAATPAVPSTTTPTPTATATPAPAANPVQDIVSNLNLPADGQAPQNVGEALNTVGGVQGALDAASNLINGRKLRAGNRK